MFGKLGHIFVSCQCSEVISKPAITSFGIRSNLASQFKQLTVTTAVINRRNTQLQTVPSSHHSSRTADKMVIKKNVSLSINARQCQWVTSFELKSS